MDLMPVAQQMQTAGLGQLARSIYINTFPAECQQGFLLRNKLQGTKIDYELPGYYKGRFQLIVRAPNYTVGNTLMTNALAALTLNEIQVGSMYVRYMRPFTLPVAYALSIGNMAEVAVDFETVFNQ